MSDRSLFLAALLLGLVVALPIRARAKGQWCNDEHVFYQAEMTLQSATVGGVPTAAPSGVSFSLQTTWGGELSARVFCPGCEQGVVSREHLRPK